MHVPFAMYLKGDSWPGEPPEDHATSCFPNPSKVDYNVLFDLDYDLGIVEGKFVASRYSVTALHLNRPQLVIERRTYQADLLTKEVLVIGHQLLNRLKKVNSAQASELAIRMGQLFIEIVNLEIELRQIRPYTPKQLR